ncbi:MAG TPA: hypothetical protein VJ506_07780 [Candidatus Limnocylindrales bacterium]|nr:hypothetical protein [Candidatus Limnocylindrales bacterium]
MMNPPFRTEVQQLRRWSGDSIDPASFDTVATPLDDPGARRQAAEVDAIVGHLSPIRSRSCLLASFAREASPSEPVRTAYAIRWLELGPRIVATGVARSRRRRVMRPLLRGRS